MRNNKLQKLLAALLIPVIMFTGVSCSESEIDENVNNEQLQIEEQQENQQEPKDEKEQQEGQVDNKKNGQKKENVNGKNACLEKIKFKGEPYKIINENKPKFTKKEMRLKNGYEHYPNLDSLGRCQQVIAKVGPETMPTEKRKGIGMIKPAGWHTVRYDNLISDKYLYNRCHLIGFQLAGENANENNLITGTRYLNVEGMLPFENQVADFVENTGRHVIYKVTPIYKKNELLCRGVKMEAKSVEDKGKGLSFNVYCFNVQPGIIIDYATGDSRQSKEYAKDNKGAFGASNSSKDKDYTVKRKYVINTNTGKYHDPDCRSVKSMKNHNKKIMKTSKKYLEGQGYEPCGNCQKN